MQAVFATVALFAATALSESVGSAIVNNACSYDVYLYNTPAADGGYTEIDEVLSPGGTYEQTFTELSNGDGWSLKLSTSTAMSNIMQYEYTFHDDGIIWYDLSDVNGNPWDGNWEITASSASSTCTPKQQAYRYATDDAYGMQACPQDSLITVTLCSGDDSDADAAASASSSAAAETSSIATATSSAFTTPSSSVATSYSYTSGDASTTATVEASSTAEADNYSSTPVSTTTFATSTTATSSVVTTDGSGLTVTSVDTAVVTDVVTTTNWHHWQRHAAAHRHHA